MDAITGMKVYLRAATVKASTRRDEMDGGR